MKKLKNVKRISAKILNKQSVTWSQTNVLVQISPTKAPANRAFNVAFSYLKITGSLPLAHIKVLLDVHTQLILIGRLNEQKGFYKHKCWPTTCAFINLRRCEISVWLYIYHPGRDELFVEMTCGTKAFTCVCWPDWTFCVFCGVIHSYYYIYCFIF